MGRSSNGIPQQKPEYLFTIRIFTVRCGLWWIELKYLKPEDFAESPCSKLLHPRWSPWLIKCHSQCIFIKLTLHWSASFSLAGFITFKRLWNIKSISYNCNAGCAPLKNLWHLHILNLLTPWEVGWGIRWRRITEKNLNRRLDSRTQFQMNPFLWLFSHFANKQMGLVVRWDD